MENQVQLIVIPDAFRKWLVRTAADNTTHTMRAVRRQISDLIGIPVKASALRSMSPLAVRTLSFLKDNPNGSTVLQISAATGIPDRSLRRILGYLITHDHAELSREYPRLYKEKPCST
jgi:hypothetical protein